MTDAAVITGDTARGFVDEETAVEQVER